jgi:ribosome-binding factor A
VKANRIGLNPILFLQMSDPFAPASDKYNLPVSIVYLSVTSRRLLKAAEAIREVIASSILTEMRDPRVQDVTVLGVEVSPDMREAKVSVSVMGTEAQQQLAIRGLQNAAGFLQSKVAKRIDTRYTPRLQFTLDKGLKKALAVGELLKKIENERNENVSDDDAEDDDSEDHDSEDHDSEDDGSDEDERVLQEPC